MLPIILPIAFKLAEMVPGLIGMMKGDKAAAVAERVVTVAKTIAGVEEPQAAVDKVMQDPELLKLFVVETNKVVVAEFEAENEALRTVNATMQAEAKSEDPFVRRWRPFFGYVVAISWGWLMTAAGLVIVMEPEKAAGMLNGLASLSTMWGVALTVLGLAVHSRSKDKRVAAGIPTPSIFDSALQVIRPASQP